MARIDLIPPTTSIKYEPIATAEVEREGARFALATNRMSVIRGTARQSEFSMLRSESPVLKPGWFSSAQ